MGAPGPGFNNWVYAGPGSIKQLYRVSAEIELIEHACPPGRQCRPVTESTEPTELVAWTFVSDPESAARRLDVTIVGDAVGCEEGRQRLIQRGLPTSSACTGPRYFKRPGAVATAAPVPSPAVAPVAAEPTWATGE